MKKILTSLVLSLVCAAAGATTLNDLAEIQRSLDQSQQARESAAQRELEWRSASQLAQDVKQLRQQQFQWQQYYQQQELMMRPITACIKARGAWDGKRCVFSKK